MIGSRSAPCHASPNDTRMSLQMFIGLVNMYASIELYVKYFNRFGKVCALDVEVDYFLIL